MYFWLYFPLKQFLKARQRQPEPKANCEVIMEKLFLQKVSTLLTLQKAFPEGLQSEAPEPACSTTRAISFGCAHNVYVNHHLVCLQSQPDFQKYVRKCKRDSYFLFLTAKLKKNKREKKTQGGMAYMNRISSILSLHVRKQFRIG